MRSIGIAGAREAVRYALKACETYEKPMVMVCGSLYLIGEVRGIWRADVKTEALATYTHVDFFWIDIVAQFVIICSVK